MIGEKSYNVIILTPKEQILSMCHIYDSAGNELVQDKDSDVKYTVLLNRRLLGNLPPAQTPEDGEEQEVQCVTIEFKQSPIYVINCHFSRCPEGW